MAEPYKETTYGFSWGPVTVERCISHKGHVVLSLKTPRDDVEVHVTPTGLVRVKYLVKPNPRRKRKDKVT